MQTEQLPSVEGEHGVVKSGGLVVVEAGRRCEQLAVPASASLEIGHGYSDVGDGWKVRHSSLLIDHGRADVDLRDVDCLFFPLRSARSSADSSITAASHVRFTPTPCKSGTRPSPGPQLRAASMTIRRALFARSEN